MPHPSLHARPNACSPRPNGLHMVCRSYHYRVGRNFVGWAHGTPAPVACYWDCLRLFRFRRPDIMPLETKIPTRPFGMADTPFHWRDQKREKGKSSREAERSRNDRLLSRSSPPKPMMPFANGRPPVAECPLRASRWRPGSPRSRECGGSLMARKVACGGQESGPCGGRPAA